MRVELPRYPAYQATGSDFVQEVPEGWDVLPLKRVSKVKTGVAKGKKFDRQSTVWLPYLRVANVQDGYLDLDDVAEIEVLTDEVARFSLKKNDVLMNEGGDADKLGRGHIWGGEIEPCLHQNHVFAIRCKVVPARWLSTVTNSSYAKAYFETRAKRTTNLASISKANLSELPVIVPPQRDQQAILAFLDRETTKIDRLMAVRQKQVECLQEQRTSVIHHAVTKGIAPQARMKPSGHPWLEDIPAHWDTYRLKFIAKLNPSKSASGYTAADAEKVVFLPMECVSTAGKIDQSNRERICDLWKGFTYFAKGDVVIAKITPCFENGKGALLSELETDIGFGTTEFHVVRAGNKLVPPFLYLITASYRFRGIGERFMTGAAGQQRVSEQFIADFPIALPPPDEQQAIVAHIDRETAKLDTLIAKYQRELELLAEYRASLISHAVTGKIDVRALVEPLPTDAP